MRNMHSALAVLLVLLGLAASAGFLLTKAGGSDKEATVNQLVSTTSDEGKMPVDAVVKSEEEWRRILTSEQFHILREKGTERAFTGKYHDYKAHGVYICAGCGNRLFSSDTKFDSGTGWPSFWAPLAEANIKTTVDRSFFMTRTEVMCARCGGHLGHVFDDGPAPTGLRYCINSAALNFVAQ